MVAVSPAGGRRSVERAGRRRAGADGWRPAAIEGNAVRVDLTAWPGHDGPQHEPAPPVVDRLEAVFGDVDQRPAGCDRVHRSPVTEREVTSGRAVVGEADPASQLLDLVVTFDCRPALLQEDDVGCG